MADRLDGTTHVRVDKLHPPKTFKFPHRKFGSQGATRTFRAEWCEKFDWLHYDAPADAAFCHVCMCAELEKKFLASTKRDVAFISNGFTNWKEATIAFKKHLSSACHREAVFGIQDLPKHVHDVGELLNAQHGKEKALNRDMFRRVLQNVRFLARQGLALRGQGDGAESNFIQLMRLRSFDCPEVLEWMDKKTNKYTSPDIQNECLQLMALHILRQVCSSICKNGFYTIMADECTDVANKEQFTICIRWVDDSLTDHEDLIGLYNVGTIDANCLVATIRDVLLRMNLKMTQCRGQYYDSASNMTGSKHGVATQLQAEESRAVLTHCYGHSLNLAIGDTMKQSKVCRDALDTAFEISKLIRFSPKRNAAFDRIKVENSADDEVPDVGIRAFCPTRWTVRGDAIQSIIDNYFVLQQLWDECLDKRLDPDVKGRIIGVKTQMSRYNLLFGLHLSKKVLKITDNLSRALQKQSLSAAEGQEIAQISLETLIGMRTNEAFSLFFKLVEQSRKHTDTDEPVLPRKRKAPSYFEVGSGEGFHRTTVEEHYRRQYFEALDLVISGIKKRFDQPGYAMYKNLEWLLVTAANQQCFEAYFQQVTSFYKDDFKPVELGAQLLNLGTWFLKERQKSVSLQDCLQYLRSLSDGQRSFYSEVCCLARLILVMPSTNAVSERSFSAMRRLKTYLRSTMRQTRLNHILLLNMYKERLDSLDLDVIGNDFVRGNEHRLRMFGNF